MLTREVCIIFSFRLFAREERINTWRDKDFPSVSVAVHEHEKLWFWRILYAKQKKSYFWPFSPQ